MLGIQGCLFTVTTLTPAHRDFMTWPRLVALVETGWTAGTNKNFASFQYRLRLQLLWLKAQGIGFMTKFAASPESTIKD